MEYIKYFLLLLLGLVYGRCHAQENMMFRHWDVSDGISDNQIRYLSVLDDGRIAIRTSSILNIFNGITFEHFYHDRRKVYLWSYNKNQIFKDYCDSEGRLWMKSPGYLLLFDLKTNEFLYDIETLLIKMGVKGRLKNMFVDEGKNYWFLTEDNHFLFYDISKSELMTIEASVPVDKYGVPCEVAQYDDLYYIIYTGGLIRLWNRTLCRFVEEDRTFMGRISLATDRLKLQTDSEGNLWLMYNQAVCLYQPHIQQWKELLTIEGASNFFTSMDVDTEGNVWVGSSWSGLRKIDKRTHEVSLMSGLQLSDGSVLNNDIQCILTDNNHGVWVGLLWQGICYYNPSMYKFRLIQTLKKETLITNEAVRCLLEDVDGSVLIGTSLNGLMRYSPQTGEISRALKDILGEKDLCLCLYRDRENRLWVGTYLNGFCCVDGLRVKYYNRSDDDLNKFPERNISRAVYESPNGRFWVSVSNKGVGELDIQTGEIKLLSNHHPEIAFHKRDYGFYEESDSVFAVYGENGIYYYDMYHDRIFIPEVDAPDSLKFMGPLVSYNCIFKDSRSLEWFATNLGIRVWDAQHNKAYTITTEDGLENNVISSIVEDDKGVCWVATAYNISRISVKKKGDIYTFQVVNFDKNDGVFAGKLYENAFLKTADGTIYLGGHHGVNVFNPSKMHYNTKQHKPVFTGFRLFNTLIKKGMQYKERVILHTPIHQTREVYLHYDENFISVEFSGMNYVNNSRSFYRYKLENFDTEWHEIRTSGIGVASYTGLRPGKYKLVVYAGNSDRIWGDEPAELSIVIASPLWATWPAYTLYALIVLGIMALLVHSYQKRRKRRYEEQEMLKREQQKEELNQMRFRFFTNISHEFRTPLTLIMTPLGILIHEVQDPLKTKLERIYHHANSLLELVNKLLDFRKLEMGGENLNLERLDLVEFVKYVASEFKELAITRSIDFKVLCELSQITMWFDEAKVQKIFNNLYSNAFKFTPDGGQIITQIGTVVKSGKPYVMIKISDTGCGIKEEDVNTIFNRFYRSDPTLGIEGSGIGLHIVKEYVKLHEGLVEVDSQLGKGTSFSVYFPTNLGNETSRETESTDIQLEENGKKSGRKTLLLVEDNLEFRHFLAEQLGQYYDVLEAGDGAQGEAVAVKYAPDLIVSDMMMPVMDGLQMCAHIKHNIQTSHIPVILLTARISDDARIESYKAGADSYISKPFNFDILLARVKMLLEQQEKRREIFHKEIEISPSSITITSLDEEFVKKSVQLVEEHIDDPQFSVNYLCEALGMSRSQLYRKFESITGQTPNDFIRSVRLKHAAQLLRNGNNSISEISDRVGFNSIKYFNKYFKEEFGLTPTQYRAEEKSDKR